MGLGGECVKYPRVHPEGSEIQVQGQEIQVQGQVQVQVQRVLQGKIQSSPGSLEKGVKIQLAQPCR